MEYVIEKEKMGAPLYKVDEVMTEIIDTLAVILKMERTKVEFFTKKMGLAWLDEPGIVGATEEQLSRINELRNFLRGIGR
ncbi:MAG TPA: hypothetical protein VIK78_04345 [Ruminiclostridium sp.]